RRTAVLRRVLGGGGRRDPRRERPHRAPRLAQGARAAPPGDRGRGTGVNLLSPDSLDAERWRRIDSVLDVVLDAAPQEVPALLDALCAGHPELRLEIEALLTADRASEGLMASPAAMLIDLLAEDALPARIGRYAVTGTLGEGGMGVVLAARDEALDR